MDELVEQYIKMRDAKDKAKAKFTEKMAPLEEAMTKIEALLLQQFAALGVSSVTTPHGTAFKSTRTSATVADWDLCLDFVKSKELWQLLERRVSKQAVEEYKQEHSDLPPGVNWRAETTVNVRRS